MRRRVRTGLTLIGISIGIAAVVALVGISRGFEKSWEVGLKARGTDIVVSNMSTSLTPKPFSASILDRISTLPHIAATCSLMVELMSMRTQQMMIVSAREWDGFGWKTSNWSPDGCLGTPLSRPFSGPDGRASASKKSRGFAPNRGHRIVGRGYRQRLAPSSRTAPHYSAVPISRDHWKPRKINVIDIRVSPATSEKE